MTRTLTRLAVWTHKQLSKSAQAARIAARARAHLQGVLAYRFGQDTNMETNGEQWLLARLAPSCARFVDVGANTGDWSETLLALPGVRDDARGVLVEPSDSACARLRAGVLRDERLELVQAVAAAEAGERTFFAEPGAGRTSSLDPRAARADAVATTVHATTIDLLAEARGWDALDVLKIDAEGHDLDVLRGATGLLAAQAIGLVQFEYNDAWMLTGARLLDAMQLFERHGYEVFLLKGEALYTFPYSVYGEFYHYSNFIALAPGAHPSLRRAVRGDI